MIKWLFDKSRRWVTAGALLCVALGGLALGQGGQVLTVLTGNEQYAIVSGTVSSQTSGNTLWGYGRAAGLLTSLTATATTNGTTAETTLATYTLPANTLNTGTTLRIKASFTASSTASNKTFKCYFGNISISSAALGTNNKNGSCELMVTRLAANIQQTYGNMLVDVTPITGTAAVATETDSSAIVIKFTGTDASGSAGTAAKPGNIVVNAFTVERLGR